MPDYRRAWHPGGTCLFTVNLLQKQGNDLLTRHIDVLPSRRHHPFTIPAWVVVMCAVRGGKPDPAAQGQLAGALDDLFTLREATQTGRKTTESGGAPQIAPFTDLICQIGFGKAETSTLQQQMRSVLGIELHGAGAGL